MDVFTLSCAKLPAHTRVMRLSGHEGLSRLYSFTLDLVMPGAEGMTFDMADAVDATATLKIQAEDGSARSTFHGILSTMDWVQEVEDHSIYRVTLVPRLWRLGLSQHSNVFVEKTVQQIVTDVLLSNQLQEGQDFDFCLGATKYEKMPHVAQYRESDLDFLARRLERDGLYYFFEQLDDHERLVITDSKGEHTVSGTVHYYAHTSHATQGAEALTSFTCRHQVRPKQVKVREYDYLRPTMDLQKVDTVHQHGVGDVVIHDENYTTPGEGQRLATVRAEELKSREVVFEGQGHTFHVRPGYLFELKSHPRQSFNGKYLAVSLTHEGSQGVTSEGTRPEDMQVPTYAVRLEAITSTVQYRPSRVTPIPRIYGTEMGLVDGEQDSPYAQIDSHGRYKVKVYFDENDPRNGRSSMWVRMLQPHGGPNEGFHFPLRKNAEVLMVFLGGDPDRPVIAGVVPNAHTPSPITQDNATQNVIHTGGGTRLEIEDNDGAQYIKMTTPPESTLLHMGAEDGSGYNVHLSSMGKALVELGGDLDIKVDGHKTEEITKEVVETYKDKHTTTVTKDHKVEITGKEDYKVTGNQKTEVVSNREVKVTGNQKHEVTGNDVVKVTANQNVEVTGSQTVKVTAGQTLQVMAGRNETITGPLTQTVTGPQTTTVTGPSTSTINGPLTQTITGGATITSPAGYKVVAPSQWFKMSAASGELVGAKIGIVAGIKTDHATLVISGAGIKVDTIGVKMEHASVKISLFPFKVEKASMKLKNAAIGLYMYGLTIFS